MKTTALFCSALILGLANQPANAHCLVFRAKLVSIKNSTATKGAVDQPLPPSTTSGLFVIDLEKEYQAWNWSADSSKNTYTPTIWIDNGSVKSFGYGSEKDPNSSSYSGITKFGFFDSGQYFYVFSSDSENFGTYGLDYGAMTVSGPCTADSVNIGGNNRSLKIPTDSTAILNRADAGIFKTFIFNMSVDIEMTVATNNYLFSKGYINSAGASSAPGTSGSVYDTTSTTSIVVGLAKTYLYSEYLPNVAHYIFAP